MSNELVLQGEVNALQARLNIIEGNTPLTKKLTSLVNLPNQKAELLQLLPEAGNKEQILKSELQSLIGDVMESAELQQCTPDSLLFCLRHTLSRGLRIGKAHKEAWVIKSSNKRKDKAGKDIWVNEARVQVGYRAYINKGWNDYKLRFVVGTITTDEMALTRKVRVDTNKVTGELIYEDVPCVVYEKSKGKITIDIPLGKETKVHTRDNVEYVYVTSISQDGETWSEVYSKESMEEKSKTMKYVDGKKSYQLSSVWESNDRSTDYQKMLFKAAIIEFNRMRPERGLNELADFDHRQAVEMEDVTPVIDIDTQDEPKVIDLNARFLQAEPSRSKEELQEYVDSVTKQMESSKDRQKILDEHPTLVQELRDAGMGVHVGKINRLIEEQPRNGV